MGQQIGSATARDRCGDGGVIDIARARTQCEQTFVIRTHQIDGAGVGMLATSCATCRRHVDDAGAHARWDRKVHGVVVLDDKNLTQV